MLPDGERIGKEKQLWKLCHKVADEIELELYDLEYQSKLLRVFVQNPQTKTALIEDCVRFDRALTPYLEEAEWVPKGLTLEVSSPGVYRQLKTHQHFLEACGETVVLTLYNNDDAYWGQQKKVKGKLLRVENRGIALDLKEECLLPFEFIKRAHLDNELKSR